MPKFISSNAEGPGCLPDGLKHRIAKMLVNYMMRKISADCRGFVKFAGNHINRLVKVGLTFMNQHNRIGRNTFLPAFKTEFFGGSSLD